MGVAPRIADVQCSRLTFQPGDRILVRSHHRLDRDQERRLRSSIVKWAGCEVEVLIFCLLDMDIEVEKR
jgi:hypothetical protein